MNLRAFGLLADENIDGDVVAFFRAERFDVKLSKDLVPPGAADVEVLRAAAEQRRVVVTHDRDFGALAVASREPFVGILFLRPGHIRPSFAIDSFRTLLSREIVLVPPFIIVLERSGQEVNVRIRQPVT